MTVESWIAMICVLAVAAGAVKILAPPGSGEKMIRFIISLTLLSVLLLPLTTGLSLPTAALSGGGSTVSDYVSSMGATLQDELAQESSDELRQEIFDCLTPLQIDPVNVEVSMDRNSDGSISIGQVEIDLKKEDMGQAGVVRDTVRSQLGLEANVMPG